MQTVYHTSMSVKNGKEEYNYNIYKPSKEFKYLYIVSNCHTPITFENTLR